jgi:hypothetical protein
MGLRTRAFYLEKAKAYLHKPLLDWEKINYDNFEREFCELKFVYNKCKRLDNKIEKQLWLYVQSVERLRPSPRTWFIFFMIPFREFLRNYGSSRRVGVAVTP